MRDYTTVYFFRILEKTVVFFYLFLFFIFTLYLSGNFQIFLDRTQQMLLVLAEFLSFTLVFLSILYGIVLLISGAGRKRRYIRKFLFFLLALLSGTFVFFFSKIILVWAG